MFGIITQTLIIQVLGARTRSWWRAIRLLGKERSTYTKRGKTFLQTNHFSSGLLSQPFYMVRRKLC